MRHWQLRVGCLGGDESYKWDQGADELGLADGAKSSNQPEMLCPLSGQPSPYEAIPCPHDSPWPPYSL